MNVSLINLLLHNTYWVQRIWVSNGHFITSIALENFLYNCIYNHRTTKTNQKYPSVNL